MSKNILHNFWGDTEPIEKEKQCKTCNKSKPLSEFPKSHWKYKGIKKYGRRGHCCDCYFLSKAKNKEKYLEQKEFEMEREELFKIGKRRCTICDEVKLWDEFPNDKVGRTWKDKKSYCLCCGKMMRARYKESDPEKYAAQKAASDKRYNKKHRKKLNKKSVNKYHTNIQHKLKVTIRNRIGKIIRDNNIIKHSSSTKSIGCSYETLIKHLESQFTDGMNWDNHGTFGWHIDHIRPLASFDLSNKKQYKEACHYTNLQPLWAEDNLKKSDIYDY